MCRLEGLIGYQDGEKIMSETWVAFKGYMAGDAGIGRIEKETDKTVSVSELGFRGDLNPRLSRKYTSDILGRYSSKEAAQKGVEHAKRMFQQHKEKVDQANSVYRQAQINQNNAFLAAFK